MKKENSHQSLDKQTKLQQSLMDDADEVMSEENSGEWQAPEVPPGAEELVVWDEVPENPQKLPRTENDEYSDASELVEEGMEEADRELRMSAADEPDDEDLSDDEEAAADYPVKGILS